MYDTCAPEDDTCGYLMKIHVGLSTPPASAALGIAELINKSLQVLVHAGVSRFYIRDFVAAFGNTCALAVIVVESGSDNHSIVAMVSTTSTGIDDSDIPFFLNENDSYWDEPNRSWCREYSKYDNVSTEFRWLLIHRQQTIE